MISDYMLKVNRIKDNVWYNYYLQDGDAVLRIIFTKMGDLYFAFKYLDSRAAVFNITKENMVIYRLFDELFNNIKDVHIYKLNDYELENYSLEELEKRKRKKQEKNEKLKNSQVYLKLVDGNTITWISDDSLSFDYKTADALRITKEDNKFILLFTYYDYYLSLVRAIRVKNIGSRYSPFNTAIFDFFHKLQEYDPGYHQICMEEYLYNKQKVYK